MRISDWSSDVCSSDLLGDGGAVGCDARGHRRQRAQHLFDILYPAKPAGAFAHPPPRAFERDRVAFRRQPDAQRPTAFDGMGVDARNLVGRCDQSFAQGKARSEEHTSELPSLMRISYAVFCLKK